MQTKDLKQLKDIARAGTYNHFSMINSKNEQILGYNARKDQAADQMDKIIVRLKSEGLPNGLYTVLAKYSQTRNAKPDEYFYQKGSSETLAEPISTPPAGFSNEMAAMYEYKIENRFLKEKIELLNKEIESQAAEILKLKTDCEALEIELNESNPETDTLGAPAPGNNITNLITGLSEAALPVLNTFLELKAKQVEAQTEYFRNMRNQAAHPQAPPEPARQRAADQHAAGFSESEQQDNFEADMIYKRIQELAKIDPLKAESIMNELFTNQNNEQNEQ